MTRERQDIREDFYSGDLKDIRVTVYTQSGTLRDLSNAELTYTVIRDDARNPQILLTKTSYVGYRDEIELTGTGICVVHLLPSDTYNLYGTFRHQLHLHDTDYSGIITSGAIQIFRAFARRLRQGSASVYLVGSSS